MLTIGEERVEFAAVQKARELQAKIEKGEIDDDGTAKVIEDLLKVFRNKVNEVRDLEGKLSSAKRKARMGIPVF